MATKRTKSVGDPYPSKSYFENAAKQFEWPINHEDKTILVPPDELEQAESNMMVSYLRKRYNWHIQSVIGEIERTRVYVAPVQDTPMFKDWRVPEPVVLQRYNVGDKFRVKSTACELVVTYVDRTKINFHYTNRDKADLLSSIEQLDRVLRMQVWEIML